MATARPQPAETRPLQRSATRPPPAADEQPESSNREPADAIADALARVRAARGRLDSARLALRDAVIDLERELRYAQELGSSLTELEESSRLPGSHISDVVTPDVTTAAVP